STMQTEASQQYPPWQTLFELSHAIEQRLPLHRIGGCAPVHEPFPLQARMLASAMLAIWLPHELPPSHVTRHTFAAQTTDGLPGPAQLPVPLQVTVHVSRAAHVTVWSHAPVPVQLIVQLCPASHATKEA